MIGLSGPYLEAVMEALGFTDQWVKLIMSCLSIVNYLVLVNGESDKPIIPSRGLRQEDLLSPYIFLMCAESFSSLINEVDHFGEIQGLKVVKGSTSISHLFFAEDSILFVK